MKPATTLTVTTLIARIQEGASIKQIALENGTTIPVVGRILYENNIDLWELKNKRKLALLQPDINAYQPLTDMPSFFNLYDNEAAGRRLLDAMISEVNRMWESGVDISKKGNFLMGKYFKTSDFKSIYRSYGLLIKITAFKRLDRSFYFLNEAEIKAEYEQFRVKMSVYVKQHIPTSKLKLIDQLKQIEKELGRAPRKKDIYKNGLYMRCYWAFGSYKVALKEAGIKSAMDTRKELAEAGRVRIKEEKAALIDYLKNLKTHFGRDPLPDEIEPGVPYEKTKFAAYWRKFSTACRKAGFLVNYSIAGKYYTQQQILEMLKNLSLTLGRVPLNRDVKMHLPIPVMEIHRRFGSLGKALLAAGVVDQNYFDKKYKQYSKKASYTPVSISDIHASTSNTP